MANDGNDNQTPAAAGRPDPASPEVRPGTPFDWDELASRGLAGVIDPADEVGRKNELIDRVHKHALARWVGSMRGRRVLDYGCGNGRLAAWLASRGAVVHGVDPSPGMVREAAARVPTGRFDVLAAGDPFADSAYDLVVSAYVLFLIEPPELTSLLRRLAAALVPGGRVVVIDKVSDGTPGCGWTMEQWTRSFSDAGLDVQRCELLRLGFSRLLAIASERPGLAGLPFLPALLRLEAKRSIGAGFAGGAYADYLFIAAPGAPVDR